MKRFLFSLVLIIVAVSQFSALSAKERVEGSEYNSRGWALGTKINIYSGWSGLMGIGIYTRHDIVAGFRLEPSLVVLCKEGTSVDLTVDLQYPFDITPEVEIYPLVGVSLNDPGVLGLGVNMGGGVGYHFSRRFGADFGAKWMIPTQKYYANPVVFSIGCGYKF